MSSLARRAFGAVLVVVACAPALDWREVQHPGAGITALFPCRPQHHMRTVMIQDEAAQMHLLACGAAGQTFGISYIDVTTTEAVELALSAMQAATIKHIRANQLKSMPFSVPGASRHSASTRASIDGTTSTGEPMHLEVGVFAAALRVYQATTIAAQRDDEATASFFAGIKVR